ncbi:DUF4149 domain-containing protein [Granulicella arctica]|uniref:DUF4149 domain-containing protein n=1 Tax=Granulicella arctica TaxID=940613 RepID=UPI0021DF61DC|nr:DUF4149 domain-containing protein [Granulicella arctica]
MTTTLRAIRLLTIVLWVGSLLFFAFVLAPVAFHVLPSTHEAGLVVGGTLIVLHRIGLICGTLFLIATLVLRPRLYTMQTALIVFMLAVTIYLQFSVLPKMERDRAEVGGDITAAAIDNPARVDFDRLHPLSEKVEGAALFAGLAIVLLMAAELPKQLPK